MATQVGASAKSAESAFPAAEVERRLRVELTKVCDDASVLRPDWEPLLDSKCVVGAVLVIEDLFPSCMIPPDKVVRKGGYKSVDEALSDMLGRIRRLVREQGATK
jgi:hypothetical protein